MNETATKHTFILTIDRKTLEEPAGPGIMSQVVALCEPFALDEVTRRKDGAYFKHVEER